MREDEGWVFEDVSVVTCVRGASPPITSPLVGRLPRPLRRRRTKSLSRVAIRPVSGGAGGAAEPRARAAAAILEGECQGAGPSRRVLSPERAGLSFWVLLAAGLRPVPRRARGRC